MHIVTTWAPVKVKKMLLTSSKTTCAALRKKGIIENKDCGEEAREDVETNNESKEFSHIVMM